MTPAPPTSTMPPASIAASTSSVPVITTEAITDYRSFLDVKSIWDDLVAATRMDHPFLTHEWVRTWWECFGRGNELFVVIAKDRRGPIGIAPLMVSQRRMYGLGIRRLESIGDVHSQRFDFIITRSPKEAHRAIWAHLVRERARWDVLQLCQVPEGSRTLHEVPALAAADGFLIGTWRSADSPYLSLRGTWETYVNGLGAKHRANLRNRFKRLSRLGEIGVETISSVQQVSPALDDGLRLEAAAWKGDAGTAISSHPARRLFYTRFAQRAADRGWLRLYFLTIDGRRIAFHYAVRSGNTLCLLKPGYDPRYARYSPSNLLVYLVLGNCFRQGLAAYDFLGADDPWKHDWTEQRRPHYWLFAFPDVPRGRLLHSAKFRLIPWAKRMLFSDKS